MSLGHLLAKLEDGFGVTVVEVVEEDAAKPSRLPSVPARIPTLSLFSIPT
jgi:hypothetical protein